MHRSLFGAALLFSAACATTSTTHGKLTELSRVEGDIVYCDHKVPEKVCSQHHPELVAQFKRANDWCPEHGLPESQCFACHPDLTFDPLPVLPETADLRWLSKAGEDVADLDAHAVKGKVTIFDFYADWCASCRKVDGHVFKKLAANDPTIAYRKINVMTWETPVAMRYIQHVPALPYLVVYGADGKKLKALHGADLAALDAAIAEARARK